MCVLERGASSNLRAPGAISMSDYSKPARSRKDNVVFDTEQDLVNVLVEHIPAMWQDTIRYDTEVRVKHGFTTTDLVVETPDLLIGVEAKLRDWKQAVAQAFLNTLTYDHSYMALPPTFKPSTMQKITSEAARWNLGVIVARPDQCDIALPAPRLCPHPHAREGVLQRLRNPP